MIKISFAAGHAKTTSGKETPDGYKEWSINDKIVRAAMSTLSKYEGVELKRFDDPTGQRDIPLKERSDSINAWGADAHIDVHANAFGSGWSDPQGVETYIHKTSPKEAYDLARNVHDRIVMKTGAVNRGVKTADFHMLRETNMTAILPECGFMTNREEAAKLKSDDYTALIGRAMAEGIAANYSLKAKVVATPKPAPTGKLYRVQVGAFSNEDNAKRLQAELKAKGYTSIIVD